MSIINSREDFLALPQEQRAEALEQLKGSTRRLQRMNEGAGDDAEPIFAEVVSYEAIERLGFTPSEFDELYAAR